MKDAEKIFLLENEMLLSIDNYLNPKTKKIIVDKINKQKNILLEIANNELSAQEKNNQSKSAIDDNFFNKKPLNINNI